MPHFSPFSDDHSIRLCFGTAQLGMPYGAANRTGMPTRPESQRLISEALAHGVTLFDTAQAYGEAEARLGEMQSSIAAQGASIITKLAPLQMEDGESFVQLEAKVEASIRESMHKLQVLQLPYVLLHRAEHVHAYGGGILNSLLRLQSEGVIDRLGVSVSTTEELRMVLATDGVTCIQVPFNIVDTRWARAGLIALLSERRDVLVCVRSVFLQGVLTQPAAYWPVLPSGQASEIAGLLDEYVARFGRESRADLACAYVRAQGWIDVAVLGMENMAQLRHNVALFENDVLSDEACAMIEAQMPALPEAFLNPAYWPKKEN